MMITLEVKMVLDFLTNGWMEEQIFWVVSVDEVDI